MQHKPKGMPTEVEKIHSALWKKVATLHAKWAIYCQLFATSEDQIQLLNRSASVFFYLYQSSVVDEILLTISRLTDPVRNKGGKRENLTLGLLEETIGGQRDAVLANRVTKAMSDCEKHCKFARELRNRRIAHLDLQTEVNLQISPLPSVTKNKIEAAFEAIQEVMNLVEEYYTGGTTAYSYAFLQNDGNSLIARLREAELYRNERESRRKDVATIA